MRVTQITVSYQETCSLPEYSNVRPSISFTADIEDTDDADDVRRHLLAQARTCVRQEIDDALEQSGKRTKYYAGPRVQMLQSPSGNHHRDILLMMDDRQDWPRGWTHVLFPHDSRGLRPAYAKATAHALAARRGGQVFDCTDGDMSRIPGWDPDERDRDGTERTAPEHLEDTLDYSEQDRTEEEWRANDDSDDDGEYEEDDEDEEPRDFVAEAMARQIARIENKPTDDGPDNSM